MNYDNLIIGPFTLKPECFFFNHIHVAWSFKSLFSDSSVDAFLKNTQYFVFLELSLFSLNVYF